MDYTEVLITVVALLLYLGFMVLGFYIMFLIIKNAVRRGIEESRISDRNELFAVIKGAVREGMKEGSAAAGYIGYR